MPHLTPTAVIAFWRDAGPDRWFRKDPAFDRRFRDRFLDAHLAAARGDLAPWRQQADGVLALLLLLDQFPRNAFRATPHMYATDRLAREVALDAIVAGLDGQIEQDLRSFCYLPLSHSESLNDQRRSLALARQLGSPFLEHAQGHHDIIARFGRFPHRNALLGRSSTPQEQAFLDAGGFAG